MSRRVADDLTLRHERTGPTTSQVPSGLRPMDRCIRNQTWTSLGL